MLLYIVYEFYVYGPTVGALNAESPKKEPFQKLRKGNMVTKQVFFLRISTIFCMREAVTISNGYRILPCPLGLSKRPKTMIYFWTFSNDLLFGHFPKKKKIFLRALGAIVPWCHRGAIRLICDGE